MNMEMKKDTTMNIGVQGGATIFMCPKCGEGEIIRSRYAKRLGIKYICKMCRFSGPN